MRISKLSSDPLDDYILIRPPKRNDEDDDQKAMTAFSAKGGIRNKKVIAYLEKFAYPDIRLGL
jgi:hypothetical protein